MIGDGQQKNELEETRRALSEQAVTAERQRQEQRFFDLLNVYFRTVDTLRFDVTTGGYGSAVNRDSFYGKDALRQWFVGKGPSPSSCKTKAPSTTLATQQHPMP